MDRSSPHLEGRNEVENRNEACVMEVAAMGSRAKLRTKEGGNRERRSLGWKAVKPRPLRFVSRVATGQEEKLLKTCEAARNIDGDEGETGITPTYWTEAPATSGRRAKAPQLT